MLATRPRVPEPDMRHRTRTNVRPVTVPARPAPVTVTASSR